LELDIKRLQKLHHAPNLRVGDKGHKLLLVLEHFDEHLIRKSDHVKPVGLHGNLCGPLE
jgi:hypothetical protein